MVTVVLAVFVVVIVTGFGVIVETEVDADIMRIILGVRVDVALVVGMGCLAGLFDNFVVYATDVVVVELAVIVRVTSATIERANAASKSNETRMIY